MRKLEHKISLAAHKDDVQIGVAKRYLNRSHRDCLRISRGELSVGGGTPADSAKGALSSSELGCDGYHNR